MHRAGSASWRLDVSDSDLAEVALFVRDAVGLVVPPATGVPPALDRPVPDRRGVLSERDRADASAQWLRWWRQILEVEFGVKRSLETRLAGRRRAADDVFADLRAVSDPPEFTALAEVPRLQAAARAGFDDAVRWQRHRRPGHFETAPNWSVIKQAVDDVAFDRRVPVDTLNATVVVLPVTGLWWQGFGPGRMLCSQAAANSPHTNYRIVYETFASNLDR